ncbi:hypothetical protein OUZ56_015953 [Daphnia magna]|uniref:Uncharacterized protein n=1 Tax=Daphnia magna TaxID=35525 RepID=A0ABR0AP92_9CRUS|nr:hypothetical protein OUZ56_015953 [Daphnia magna]
MERPSVLRIVCGVVKIIDSKKNSEQRPRKQNKARKSRSPKTETKDTVAKPKENSNKEKVDFQWNDPITAPGRASVF